MSDQISVVLREVLLITAYEYFTDWLIQGIPQSLHNPIAGKNVQPQTHSFSSWRSKMGKIGTCLIDYMTSHPGRKLSQHSPLWWNKNWRTRQYIIIFIL